MNSYNSNIDNKGVIIIDNILYNNYYYNRADSDNKGIDNKAILLITYR